MEHINHGVGLNIRIGDHGNSLMQIGIKGLARRIDGLNFESHQNINKAFQSELNTFSDSFLAIVVAIDGCQRALQIVHNGQQVCGKPVKGKFVGVLDVALSAAAHILHSA